MSLLLEFEPASDLVESPSIETAKALGAYYTAQEVADFLVRWAVRSSSDRVLDPSFGGGVFLRSACKRLLHLKGSAANQVFGIEIDASVYGRISEKLSEEFGVRPSHLYRVDFFNFESAAAQMDAIVGNPPFIRYQRFRGESRSQALECAARAGVRLSELCSSWAPFLVHSVGILRPGGRLAMVVPAELGHAGYARPVLEYLRSSFRTVSIATFRKKLFPDLSEDTYLLLADEKGAGPGSFQHRDFAHAGELQRFQHSGVRATTFRDVDLDLEPGGTRFSELMLAPKIRDLYRSLREGSSSIRLGELADVGIGYVTGANDFFHLTPAEARRREIPEMYLHPAVRNGRGFKGVRVTRDDWETGKDGYLLRLPTDSELPPSVQRYLEEGVSRGVPTAYKCRMRTPWFRVPHVYHPDAFLTYMSGSTPRLVANELGAVAPNTLHILRFHPRASLDAASVSVLWLSALSRLSVEIEGHSMGGGMLKVEPTEARNVLIPTDLASASHELSGELDQLLRAGRSEEADTIVDQMILRDGLGLTRRDCQLLRDGVTLLRERRCSRGSS